MTYWGKRDEQLNLPFTDSLSVTLDRLGTTMRVQFLASLGEDALAINGVDASPAATARVTAFLNRVRTLADTRLCAQVESWSEAPLGAGLASSAAAFAALTRAAARALGLERELGGEGLSRLARQGSGSAARSIFGGLVQWSAGVRDDGEDSVAMSLYGPDYWPLTLLVVITSGAVKSVSSGEAMRRTVETSPFYAAFRQSTPGFLLAVRSAWSHRSWDALGPAVEGHALLMHAAAFAARPPIRFWNPATVRVMEEVEHSRQEGRVAYYTMDAGPNVVVVCQNADAPDLVRRFGAVPGVDKVIPCHPGTGFH